jgi:hypothetical protein
MGGPGGDPGATAWAWPGAAAAVTGPADAHRPCTPRSGCPTVIGVRSRLTLASWRRPCSRSSGLACPRRTLEESSQMRGAGSVGDLSYWARDVVRDPATGSGPTPRSGGCPARRMALAVLTGQASIPVLLVVFFATTTADTVFHNASHAALPMVVDRGQLRGFGGTAGHPARPAATRTGRGPVRHPGRHHRGRPLANRPPGAADHLLGAHPGEHASRPSRWRTRRPGHRCG